jgi:hypothetical protein
MSERQEAYVIDDDAPDNALWVMRLTVDERKLIKRVREAAMTGQPLWVDTDSMTWRALGRLENIAKR